MRDILVIKLGALGDMVHAFHAFAAIRLHHAADRVSLLTTGPFAELARRAPWFDAVLIDERPPWWNFASLARTRRLIRPSSFVYDLQTSRRSGRYFHLAGRPPWSGIALGCSHPHDDPRRDLVHTVERQRGQLRAAGIERFPSPARDWLPGGPPAVPRPYAILAPGGAGVGSVKRWPVDRYAGLAAALASWGHTPVVIGGAAERVLGAAVTAHCPAAIDLTGRTSLFELAALGAEAALAIGNDTGPLHLVCSMGAPTVALFSEASVREQAGPRGPAGEWATVIEAGDLRRLSVDRVLEAVSGAVGH